MSKAGLAAIAILAVAHAQAAAADIKGRWAVDLEPMVKQAKALKATEAEIAQMKRTFEGGLMVIDDKTIALSVDGVPGKPVIHKYKVISQRGSCVALVMSKMRQTMNYCLKDGTLRANDPSSAVTPVYRRR